MRAAGSKNYFSASTLDQMPKQLQSGLMFGHWLSIAVPDIARTDFMLVLGAKSACVYGRIGTCTQAFGTLASWLIDVLNTLTGNLDQPGGVLFAKAPAFAANTAGKNGIGRGIGRGIGTGRHHGRVSGAPEVFGELPIVQLAEEIETPGAGQIKALIVVAGNPVLSAPNGQRLAAWPRCNAAPPRCWRRWPSARP